MAWEALVVTQFLTAVIMVGLGAWLVYTDPSSRIRRALSLFLFVHAVVVFLGPMTRMEEFDTAFWFSVRGYFQIAQLPAIVNFFIVYNWRRPARAVRVGRWGVLGATAIFEILYLVDHNVLHFFNADGNLRRGPLGFLLNSAFTFAALVAIYFAVAAERTPVRGQARFHRLLALGLASFALVNGILVWVRVPTQGITWLFPEGFDSLATVSRVTGGLAAPSALTAFFLVAFFAFKRRGNHTRGWWSIGIAAASSVPPVIATLWTEPGPNLGPLDPSDYAFHFVLGASRLIFPVIVAYAVSRHTLSTTDPFELDYRFKIGIRRSTIGAIVLAAFFVFAEGLQDVFESAAVVQSLGPAWSRIIALVLVGLLLIFFHPLQRFAEHLAHSALPDARPNSDMTDRDRLSIYQEQVSIAWADGNLSRKERLLLDRLRERLGIPLREAVRIESNAVQGPG